MVALDRQKILSALQEDWGLYVQRFRQLDPEAQSAFLAQQGYKRFADLLAHVMAWWQVGYESVQRYLADAQAQPREIEVDVFNAEAVAKSAGFSEARVTEDFERMRSFLVDFVKSLPDAAFDNERVIKQFNMEFVGHLDEHKLPGTNS